MLFTQLLYRVGDLFAVSTVDWADIVDRPVVIGEAILYHYKKEGGQNWTILLRIKDIIQCVFEADVPGIDSVYIKVLVDVEDIPRWCTNPHDTCVRAPSTNDERYAIITDGPWRDMWEF
jgi:hypothetical protein